MRKATIIFAAIILLATTAMAEVSDVILRSSVTKPQPMTGLVLWPDQAESLNATHGQSIQLEYAYCLDRKSVV